jgi:lambda family phage tail tape measure protein
MADSILELIFSADTKELDEAKEKLSELGEHMPTVGEGIEKLAQSFKNLPGPIGLAAAAAVGFALGLKEMVEGTLEAETQLLELSEAMGVPIEKAQPFIEAMALSGISGDKLTASMSKLAQAVGQAITEPTGKAADAFKKLGISQDELKNGDTEQIMKDAAAGLDKYADSASKTAAIRELFGKQGPAIIAAMKSEAEMEEKAKQAQADYGTAVSEADAKSAKYFGETLKLGMTMFEGVAMSVTKSLLPGLQVLVDQFAESGKQGGIMRDVLDGLSATISVVSKAIITLLVEPIRFAAEWFKEAGVAIGASMAAIAAAAHGHFGEAKEIMVQMNQDLNAMAAQYGEATVKFEKALWAGKEAVDTWGEGVEEAKPKLAAFDANAIKVTDTLQKLAVELIGQTDAWRAAGQGLEAYKQAQDNAAIAAKRLEIAKENGSKQAQDEAEALMRAANAAKQAATEEVAGWNLINGLIEEQNALVSHNTELEKARMEIAKNPGMTEVEKAALLALAQNVDMKKQQLEVDKEVLALNQMVTKSIDQEKASMTLSTNALKLYNEQLKLKQQYEKDMQDKSVDEQNKLTAAYKAADTALVKNNQDTLAWQQSMAGFTAGAGQALTNLYDQSKNLNQIGGQLVTTFANNLATAFENIGKKGTNSFEQMGIAMVQFIEQTIVKMALMKAMITAIDMLPGGAAFLQSMSAANMLKSANGNAFSGGSVIPFANGGVIDGPTIAPMALMGEAGPEAIMPLQRGADGKLGVHMSGANAGGGIGITNHNATFVINSNQNPKDIAKQTKKQVATMAKFSKGSIAKQQRPGGLLNNRNQAFAR